MVEVPDTWTWPPETDEFGAATFAEITRMSTGPVAGSWRIPRVPADDPWYVR